MANATVTLPPSARNRRSWRSFKRHAGFTGGSTFDEATGELIFEGADQATVDASLVTYVADQANIDNDLDADDAAVSTGALIQRYDNDPVLIAIADVFREELNVLRALHALPDIQQGQMNGKVHNKIANP